MSGIVIRKSVLNDVHVIAKEMRQSDRQEIWASHRQVPLQALLLGINRSIVCSTVEFKGKPVAMFGVVQDPLTSYRGVVWMLATNALDRMWLGFLRRSRKCIDIMLRDFSVLYNFVDARNVQSVAWLRWCGANVHEAGPYGIDKMPFHYFEFGGI